MSTRAVLDEGGKMTPLEFDPRTMETITSRYTDYGITAHQHCKDKVKEKLHYKLRYLDATLTNKHQPHF
jgi:hypothetical protein